MSLFAEPWGNYLLKDIVETSLPATISWWPTTIGWQFVLLLMLAFTFKKLYLVIKHYQQNAYRRDALICLAQISNAKLTCAGENNPLYRKLPALLRSAALHAYARSEIASLSGRAWEVWLDKQCDESHFGDNCAGILDKLAYQTSYNISDSEFAQLSAEIKIWLQQHRSSND